MSHEEQSSDGSMNAQALDTVWQALQVQSTSKPAGRCGHGAISCNEGKRMVIFGGYNAEGILDDVWALNLDKREWVQVAVAGPSPPPRAFFRGCDGPPPGGDTRKHASFAYIFGGSDVEGNVSNDVWCLDVESMVWEKVHEGGTPEGDGGIAVPSPRTNHVMCRMDDVLTVHGGESSTGEQLDDLWLFSPISASWHEVLTSQTGPRPCARSSHCLAYASADRGRSAYWGENSPDRSSGKPSSVGSVVLFGGLGIDGGIAAGDAEEEPLPLNDLWVLSPASAAHFGVGSEVAERSVAPAMGNSQPLPVWSSVMLDRVGPSPRSLSALVAPLLSYVGVEDSSRGVRDHVDASGGENWNETAELFLFGGYGLVELPSDGVEGSAHGEDSDEGENIIMAYVDDLWGLKLQVGRSAENIADSDDREKRENYATEAGAYGNGVVSGGVGWVDEQGMGFAGPSPVEGRNGHTLACCGDKLILFGGFVGDGFDSGVHVAETPSLAALE